MRAGELIKVLQTVDENTVVLVASDAEGNAYGELYAVSTDQGYLKEGYEISVHFLKLTEELEEEGYTEDDMREDARPCVVLCP